MRLNAKLIEVKKNSCKKYQLEAFSSISFPNRRHILSNISGYMLSFQKKKKNQTNKNFIHRLPQIKRHNSMYPRSLAGREFLGNPKIDTWSGEQLTWIHPFSFFSSNSYQNRLFWRHLALWEKVFHLNCCFVSWCEFLIMWNQVGVEKEGKKKKKESTTNLNFKSDEIFCKISNIIPKRKKEKRSYKEFIFNIFHWWCR